MPYAILNIVPIFLKAVFTLQQSAPWKAPISQMTNDRAIRDAKPRLFECTPQISIYNHSMSESCRNARKLGIKALRRQP